MKTKHVVAVQIPLIINQNLPIYSMQVGVVPTVGQESIIDILVQFSRSHFYLDECIVGKITVNKLLIPITLIMLSLSRVEAYVLGKNAFIKR